MVLRGNKVYNPETVVFVPHEINILFLSKKADRCDFPIGVSYEKDKKKFRAYMSFMGEQIKLGTFDSAESAFDRYKEHKEGFIQDLQSSITTKYHIRYMKQ